MDLVVELNLAGVYLLVAPQKEFGLILVEVADVLEPQARVAVLAMVLQVGVADGALIVGHPSQWHLAAVLAVAGGAGDVLQDQLIVPGTIVTLGAGLVGHGRVRR